MQALVTTRGRLRKTTITAVLTASCAAGLMVFAALNEAEAAKGGNVRAPTTGTVHSTPSPVVRDHRGQQQVRPPGSGVICRKGRCWRPLENAGRVRDHRS